ncbi:alpha/beta-hydrolase [Gautieria morchelliformis]|nr:alpha/beta-hydrolase [Gautieria morchelliformis]
MVTKLPTCLTCPYKDTQGLKAELDLYLPPSSQEHPRRLLPSLVYFHGGGLTVGEKTSWFPFWIHDRAVVAGFAFISANYQLIPPATGHQIVEDIRHIFAFLESGIDDVVNSYGRDDRIDVGRIAVMGTSAGGLCAYLAGIHAHPKPRAVLSMYGMGGDFFTRHYLAPKSTPFFRGREILDPKAFSDFIFPNSAVLSPVFSSPLSYYGTDHPIPGYPSNPRMLLARLYLQLGNFIDYYTGEHQGSISETLRDHLSADKDMALSDWSSLIPPAHQPLFPQLNVSAFPPTFFIHGSHDTAVPVEESQSLHRQLQASGIASILKVCTGMEHSFDYQPDAGLLWTSVFDEAFDFIKDQLHSN